MRCAKQLWRFRVGITVSKTYNTCQPSSRSKRKRDGKSTQRWWSVITPTTSHTLDLGARADRRTLLRAFGEKEMPIVDELINQGRNGEESVMPSPATRNLSEQA